MSNEKKSTTSKNLDFNQDYENLDFNQDYKNMDFDALENKEGQELTADFLSLETINDNQPHNYFVTGITTFTDNQTGETKPAVSLIGKGNVSLICGAKTVVTACEKLTTFPVPIRIIVNGKTKGKNGSYWNARVLSL